MNHLNFRTMFFAAALVLFGSIAAHIDLEGLAYIECGLRLKARASRAHDHDNEYGLHVVDDKSDRASFTHPHIPIADASGTSQNWSGYAALTNLSHPQKNVVTAVDGSWIVPTLSSASHTTYCSLWVGIDGYSDSTVEQIGTESDWSNGHQQNYAWFEMYPNYSYEITGFPVRPGDVISASVVYEGNGIFVLTMANSTAGVHTTIPTSYTTSHTAQRSSAEWILEAPYSGGILPLSHFNTAHFNNCTATINGVTGAINNSHWVDDQLTMVTSNGTVKAATSALSSNGESFTVVWHHE